jgi:outer membrane immunogenic protein
MRCFAWAAVVALSAVGVTQSALAADMPVKARPADVAPIFSWTGLYIGVNAGGAWSDNDAQYANPFTGPGNVFAVCRAPAGATLPAPTTPNPFNLSGTCSSGSTSFVGGGQIGYNWQSAAFVYGIEGDIQWREHESNSFVRFGDNPTAGDPMGSIANDTAYHRAEQNAFGTLRGRLGYAPTMRVGGANWLLYVTGGLAVGRVNHSVTEVLEPGNTCVAPSGTTCRTTSEDKIKAGYAVGAGIEVAFAGNWSVGAEYLFVDLGKTTLTLAPIGGFFSNSSTSTWDNQSHIARAKLNYRFGSRI